jgi:exosortase A
MAAVIPRASEVAHATNWSRFAVLATVLVAVPLAYWPATRSLIASWLDFANTTYTHGFLIFAISVWMVWRVRARAIVADQRARTPGERLAVVLLLLVIVLAWQLAYRAGIQTATQLLLLPLMWCAVLALLGRNAARAIRFPLGFLVFAIPVWDYLNPIAQWSSIFVVRFMLRVTGIPAYFDSTVVQLPGGSFEIAQGCSGLHFIIVALALAALLGELRGDDARRRVGWLLVAAALAMFTNWLRIYTIILAGYLTDMQHYLVRVSHYSYGWVLFLLTVLALFLIDRSLPERAPSAAEPCGSPGAYGHTVVLSPFVLAICGALALPVALNSRLDAQLSAMHVTWAAATQIPGWGAVNAADSPWHPKLLNPDHERHLRFTDSASTVYLYQAEYSEQRQGKKLGGLGNRVEGDSEVTATTLAGAAGGNFSALRLTRSGAESLLWFTYVVDGRAFTSATRAQLWYSWITLIYMRPANSTVLALWSPCDPDCSAAGAALDRFVTAAGARL